MKKHRKALFVCLCVITTILSACSYREFEALLKEKLNNEDKYEYINETTIPKQSDDDIEFNDEDNAGDELKESEKEELFFIGDTILRDGLEYTLNDIKISGNINEVGLDKVEFGSIRYELLKEDGSISGHHQLVTVDVTIKNISAIGYDTDGENDKPKLYIEDLIGFKTDLEDPNGPFTIELSYFSHHRPFDENLGKNYRQFFLGVGEEIEVKVGWLVPSDRLNEESLYYLNGSAGFNRDMQYFQLTSNGEIIRPNEN